MDFQQPIFCNILKTKYLKIWLPPILAVFGDFEVEKMASWVKRDENNLKHPV